MLDKGRQFVQLRLRDLVGAHQDPRKPRAILVLQRWVLPVPFERFRARHAAQAAVGQQVVADAGAVEIIGEPVHVAVRVARAAGELPLKRVERAREDPLAQPDGIV